VRDERSSPPYNFPPFSNVTRPRVVFLVVEFFCGLAALTDARPCAEGSAKINNPYWAGVTTVVVVDVGGATGSATVVVRLMVVVVVVGGGVVTTSSLEQAARQAATPNSGTRRNSVCISVRNFVYRLPDGSFFRRQHSRGESSSDDCLPERRNPQKAVQDQ